MEKEEIIKLINSKIKTAKKEIQENKDNLHKAKPEEEYNIYIYETNIVYWETKLETLTDLLNDIEN